MCPFRPWDQRIGSDAGVLVSVLPMLCLLCVLWWLCSYPSRTYRGKWWLLSLSFCCLRWGGVCPPSPCDYSATTGDITQALYCVNITNVYLLTAGVVLCYSRVRVCIKGRLNLSLDILCWVCLRLARGTYSSPHTLSTHIYLWILPVIKHLTTRVICGRTSGLVTTTVCASCQPLMPCEYYQCFSLQSCWSCVRLMWPFVLTRGEGVDLC